MIKTYYKEDERTGYLLQEKVKSELKIENDQLIKYNYFWYSYKKEWIITCIINLTKKTQTISSKGIINRKLYKDKEK